MDRKNTEINSDGVKMRALNLLLITMLLMPIAFAKIETFTTKVNVTVTNNTFRISTEDKQMRVYSAGSNVFDPVLISFNRNVSCKEEQLYDFITSFTQLTNESNSYKVKYDQCVTDRSNLQGQAYFDNATTWQSKFNDCSNSLGQYTNTDPGNSQQCQQALQNQKKDSGTKNLYWAAVGFGLCYLIFVKKTLAKGPADGLPPSR